MSTRVRLIDNDCGGAPKFLPACRLRLPGRAVLQGKRDAVVSLQTRNNPREAVRLSVWSRFARP